MTDRGALPQSLGRRDVLTLAFGAMIGWSWVVLSGTWLAEGGLGGTLLAFLLGGVIMLVIGSVYAELASALPWVGGEHVYAQRAFGPGAAFLCAWAITLGYFSVSAFEAVALPTVLETLVPGLDAYPLWTLGGWTVTAPWAGVGCATALLLTLLNMRGLRFAAVMQTVLVLAMVGVGLLLFFGAFGRGAFENSGPLFPKGLSGFSAVLMMVPFLFVGFDVIPQAAEELRIPRRSIGALLLTAVALAALWYAMVAASVALALPVEGRAAASLATADAMSALWGPEARALLVLAGLGGILSSWNAFMIGGSRAIYAMAQAGQLPAVFARRHPRYQTPTAALALLGGLSACAPFFGRPALVWLVDAGGLGITVAYAWVAAAFLALRRREPELPRPFRLPGGPLLGYAALIASLGLSLLYLPFGPAALTWPAEWAIVLGWAGLGAGLYALARRPS